MSTIAKFLLAVSTLLFVGVAHADIPDGKSAFSANASLTNGGLGLGVDFENGMFHTYSVGGYFRLLPSSQSNGANGVTTVGAFVRPHFSRQQWDLYLSPGVGLVFFSPAAANSSNQVYLGPSLGLGLMYEFNPKFSVGYEYNAYAMWIGGTSTYRGLSAAGTTDLAIKVRFIY